MNTEDFERLKAVCEKEGFVVSTGGVIPGSSILVEVYKKDSWQGVEFIEFIDTDLKGKIYKIQSIDSTIIYLDRDDTFGNTYAKCYKEMVNPSTEQAYVEQLKKEAFERFGEIKVGDSFDFTNTGFPYQKNKAINFYFEKEWKYSKQEDKLLYYGWVIYQQGKWAERVNERVKITPLNTTTEKRNNDWKIDFSFSANNRNFSLNGASTFLAKQLEKYLNNEIE